MLESYFDSLPPRTVIIASGFTDSRQSLLLGHCDVSILTLWIYSINFRLLFFPI
jgi:hypothetical protein